MLYTNHPSALLNFNSLHVGEDRIMVRVIKKYTCCSRTIIELAFSLFTINIKASNS